MAESPICSETSTHSASLRPNNKESAGDGRLYRMGRDHMPDLIRTVITTALRTDFSEGLQVKMGRRRTSRSKTWRSHLSAAMTGVLVLASGARADGPHIGDRFPVNDRSNLSLPVVEAPIHECALAVFVSGFVPSSTVRVYAFNPTTLIADKVGEDSPFLGYGEIKLNRPLLLGEQIRATQTVGGVTSGPSHDAVTVDAYPTLTKPVVDLGIYECGRVVPVRNLIASTRVEATDRDAQPSALLGTAEATGDWEPVVTSALIRDHYIHAQQIACPDMPSKTAKSATSVDVKVKPEPSPLPVPTISPSPVPGTNAIDLYNLLAGAEIEVKDGATVIGVGLANGPANCAKVSPITSSSASITATQKLCHQSAPSVPVSPATSLPPLTVGSPICEGSNYVFVSGSVMNANVALIINNDWSHAILGGAGKPKISVGVTLHNGDALTAVQNIGNVYSLPSNEVVVGCGETPTDIPNVVTQHNDNRRTGVNPSEFILTPAKVRAQGMQVKYKKQVKGWINTQPLYVSNVPFSNGAANGLFVGTLFSNTVYGLDADTGAEKWVHTLADSDPNARSLAFGVDCTPVIDVTNRRLYVVFATKNQVPDMADGPDSSKPIQDGKAHVYQDQLSSLDLAYWIVALDCTTGKELNRVRIEGSTYRADGTPVTFVGKYHRNHAALLLDHGAVYVAFCSIAGSEGYLEYHGWLMAYRASDLVSEGVFCTSKNFVAPTAAPFSSNHVNDAAGIWQGGGGPSTDADGNVYLLTGNGTADIANQKYGDCFLKLTPTGTALIPTAFIPSDADTLNRNDADLGAGGPLTIPSTNLVVGGGKSGYMYLLESGAMTLIQQWEASTNQYDPTQRDQSWDLGPHLHGSPTYWRGPDPIFGNLYVWGEKDFLRQYRFNTTTGKVETAAHNVGKVRALRKTMPGGMLSLSSNGTRSGSGILWATLPEHDVQAPGTAAWPGHLYAFDAETLQPLWDTSFSSLGHWLPPTIAAGKVFIGTSSNELIAYELGPPDGSSQSHGPPSQPQSFSYRKMAMAEDKAEMLTIPKNTLIALTPSGVEPTMVLVADGVLIYASQPLRNQRLRFSWKLTSTAVKAQFFNHERPDTSEGSAELKISSTNTWTASDGSLAETKLVKSYNAPDNQDAPWGLYKVTRTSGQGVLSGIDYIACVYTAGGRPPASPPTRRRDTNRAAYHAQYILYRKP